MYNLCGFFFFFKQKTAYEMRISDWSSDVCSSDLNMRGGAQTRRNEAEAHEWRPERAAQYSRADQVADAARRSGFRMLAQEREQIDRARKRPAQMIDGADHEIGRASWRERVCKYV